MQGPSHLLAAAGMLLLLGAPTANAQDSTRRKVPLPTKPSYQRVVTRLCNVYQSGAMYCRNIDDLHAKEWAKVDRRQLQEMFKKVYEANGFDLRYNGLISCGSGIPAAARQSLGALPSARDSKNAIDACLTQFGVAMGRGHGKQGAFGNAPVVPGRGGSTGTGSTSSCRIPGDPRRAGDGGAVDVWARPVNPGDKTVYALPPDQETVPDELITPLEDRGGLISMIERVSGTVPVYQEPTEEPVKTDDGDKQPTDPGASSCEAAVKEFEAKMAECARFGTTSYFCEKMMSCSEPMVTNPNPGGPATKVAASNKSDQRAVRCGDVEVYSEDQLRGALLKQCGSKVQPDPDGGSPCGPRGGGSYVTTKIVKNLCNTVAPILTEDCLGPGGGGEVTFPTLRKNMQEVINEARAKLGGPIVVLPVGPSPGPCPANRPNC